MAMLAERKRKQRWILNPRGKQWAEDKNGFGQKLMEKLGWKHGKGLGANEDGIKESVKLTYKNDSKGVGYKEVEQWTAHDDNFSTLLKNLNGNVEESLDHVKASSLEAKSQNCRARIHYHKFTKGKDISRYSEKDLASILGKKTLKQNVKNESNVTKEESTGNVEDRYDETLINKGSMTDYFKKKLSNFTKNKSDYVIGNNGVLTVDKSDSENERVGFGFGFVPQKQRKLDEKCEIFINENSKENNEETEQNCNETSDRKQRKKHKKKKEKSFSSYVYETNGEIENDFEQNDKTDNIQVKDIKTNEKRKQDSLEDDNECTKRSKKCKKSKELISDNSRIEENGHMKKKDLNENVPTNKKKIKKKKLQEDKIKECISEPNKEIIENMYDKKKEKKTNLYNNEVLDDISDKSKQISADHDESTHINEEIIKKQSKRKKLKKNKEETDIGISNPAFNDFNISSDNNSLHVEENMSVSPIRTKRKRKYENINGGIENPALNTSTDSQSDASINPYEVKIKKRKYENNDKGIENPSFNVSADSIPDACSNNYEVKAKRKKKLGKPEIGVDNPALNLSDVIVDNELMLNVVNTPVIVKKNIGKFDINSSMEKVRSAKKKSVRFSDILQERIIPNDPSERINEYISKRNELFDINTMVIEESAKQEMEKQGLPYENGFTAPNFSDCENISKIIVESSVQEELQRGLNSKGFINNGFDIRSVDKINFYEHKYEVKSSNNKGIDNKAFNKLKNHVEENVETMSNTIERFQAEVENDINESKANANTNKNSNISDKLQDWLVGDVGKQINRNIKIKEGSKLCFKDMHFKTPVPSYVSSAVNRSKKSYRHLIRGDITVGFKNSNLHDIIGYAVDPRARIRMS